MLLKMLSMIETDQSSKLVSTHQKDLVLMTLKSVLLKQQTIENGLGYNSHSDSLCDSMHGSVF